MHVSFTDNTFPTRCHEDQVRQRKSLRFAPQTQTSTYNAYETIRTSIPHPVPTKEGSPLDKKKVARLKPTSLNTLTNCYKLPSVSELVDATVAYIRRISINGNFTTFGKTNYLQDMLSHIINEVATKKGDSTLFLATLKEYLLPRPISKLETQKELKASYQEQQKEKEKNPASRFYNSHIAEWSYDAFKDFCHDCLIGIETVGEFTLRYPSGNLLLEEFRSGKWKKGSVRYVQDDYLTQIEVEKLTSILTTLLEKRADTSALFNHFFNQTHPSTLYRLYEYVLNLFK